jgi:hypothetical protein
MANIRTEGLYSKLICSFYLICPRKKQVLEAYSAEMRLPPHSRSIENAIKLSALRDNAIGVDYTEALQMVRDLR